MEGSTQKEILEKYRRYCRVRRGNSDSTIRNEMYILQRFFTWLQENGLQVDEMNQDIVDDYLMYCTEKYARNSLVPITIALRKLCQLLEKNILVKVAQVKAPNRDKNPLTQNEIDDLFNATKGNPKEYAILKTMYYSGIRENELMDLEIDDVDFSRENLLIKHGKGDRRRVVNITSDCAEAIKRWLQVRPQPAKGHEKILFLSTKGMKLSHYHVYKIVVENAAKAGITKKVYPHLMRVSHITHAIENGMSPREIQAQSGHRDIGTLMGYVQHTAERIRQSYNKVFEDEPSQETADIQQPSTPNISNDHWKKIAMQKYLVDEIDLHTLKTILDTIEDDGNKGNMRSDPSYR